MTTYSLKPLLPKANTVETESGEVKMNLKFPTVLLRSLSDIALLLLSM
jgi:hypothetical protein